MTSIKTHRAINEALCGRVVRVEDGYAEVELVITEDMVVDDLGLAHGGFVFGLADHAAMVAVNHPYVVLHKAVIEFVKPVRLGETLVAAARVVSENRERRPDVHVAVRRGKETMAEGTLSCVVLSRHVLS